MARRVYGNLRREDVPQGPIVVVNCTSKETRLMMMN